MKISLDESIAIYARVTMKWFGAKAHERIRDQIERMSRVGDAEGVRVYQCVSEHISAIERQRASAP